MNQWNSRLAREKQPAKRPCVKHMTWNWRVMLGCEVHKCFARRAILWCTRETLCLSKKLFALPNSLPTLYIPLLRTKCKVCFLERKPSQIHLRVRDCYTYNHLHIFSWFSSTPTSPSLHPWEVFSPNTYHTHFECQVRFWCCWKALEGDIHWRMQSGWIARSGKLEKTRLWEVRW